MDLLDSALASRPFVIDAIFGTGFAGVPRGLAAETIEAINRSGCRVVAVDIASGVNADDGNAPGPAVRAELTVTMALPKLGHLLFPGRACTGLLEVADIGIPPGLTAGGDTFLLDAAHVRSVLPERRPDGHKGTFGTALVVAGSRGFSGAACLAGMAAVRSGAGLVRLAFPAGIAPVVESRVIEAVKAHLPETTTGTLARAALAALRDLLPDADALAVGPGISTEPEAAEVARELITLSPVPVVIDADGLNNIAGRLALLGSARAPLVLTPHPGEFCRLSGVTPSEVNSNRIEVCRRFAAEHRVVLVLKGAPTVIGSPDGIVLVNPTGNSGLASGGTGDVLTGLLVGLLAQGARPLDAAAAAAFLHGLAADIGVRTRTEYCLSASDLLDFLPAAFQSVLSA
jgi:NAD(P)H-hydrate epimerase